jgi:hypothetical protein
VTIFLLVAAITKRFGNFERETADSLLNVGLDVETMILKYRALIEILILPFTALNGWLMLGYPKITYPEFLITGFYRFGVFYVFLTAQYLLGLIFGINPEATVSIYSIAVFFMAWTVYVFYDFFKLYNVNYLTLRIMSTMVIGSAIYVFLRTMFAKLFIALGF